MRTAAEGEQGGYRGGYGDWSTVVGAQLLVKDLRRRLPLRYSCLQVTGAKREGCFGRQPGHFEGGHLGEEILLWTRPTG